MTTHEQTRDAGAVRETYEEYSLGKTTVAMIADPENEHAWIQSTVVQQVVE